MGSSSGSAGLASSMGLSGPARTFWARLQARPADPREMAAKGMIGMPGTRAMTPAAADTMPRAAGFMASCMTRALSAAPSTPALETRMPAAMEITRAGTWLTRPSPMVMMV